MQEAPRVDFNVLAGDFFLMQLGNLALSILTLGIYRFWGKAKYRRFLWGQTTLDGDALEVPHPVNVVEVLSPTTAPLDTTSRLTGHIEVVGLEHYRIVDPTRKTDIHHRRANSESIETRIVTGSELQLDPPGLVVETRLFFN